MFARVTDNLLTENSEDRREQTEVSLTPALLQTRPVIYSSP